MQNEFEVHADAELLRLWAEVEPLIERHKDAIRRWQPQWRADAEYRATLKWPVSDADIEACHQRADRNFPATAPHPDDVTEIMHPMMERILVLPAHTVDGLKVKASAAKFACQNYWDDSDDDADWDTLYARKLIDAVLMVA